jgi:hypothetical protein
MNLLEEFRNNIQILFTDEENDFSRGLNAGLKAADKVL